MKTITQEQAAKIWDILVKEAGANKEEYDKNLFISIVTEPHDFIEYTFGGYLGFGGKFKFNNGEIYVCCYSEQLNAARRDIINKVNKLLEEI